MELTLQPVIVATGEDGEGFLVFGDGVLFAVLVRLSSAHGGQAGCWFLEKGFGILDAPQPEPFETVDDATAWIRGRIARHARTGRLA